MQTNGEAKKEAKREAYDRLRKSIPDVESPDILVITTGVREMGQIMMLKLLGMVRDFDTFTKDNDPYGEHDFGMIEIEGQKNFWKIDDYRGSGEEVGGVKIRYLLTVMKSEEY